jgi:hypothetical protein
MMNAHLTSYGETYFFFLSRALSFLSTSSRIMRPHPGQIHTHIFILTRCFDSMREAAGASAALFANAYRLHTCADAHTRTSLSLKTTCYICI